MNVNVHRRSTVANMEIKTDALISMFTPNRKYRKLPVFPNMISIACEDTTRKHRRESFSRKQAKIVLKFILDNHGSNFVIHCDAGISRSVAVGLFMADYMGYKVTFYQTHKPYGYNKLIYNMILSAWGNHKDFQLISKMPQFWR